MPEHSPEARVVRAREQLERDRSNSRPSLQSRAQQTAALALTASSAASDNGSPQPRQHSMRGPRASRIALAREMSRKTPAAASTANTAPGTKLFVPSAAPRD